MTPPRLPRIRTAIHDEFTTFARAFAAAPVKLDVTYSTPDQTHAMMEPHASIASWNGGKLTLWTWTQVADSLALITRLIDAGAGYLHASPGSALDQKPATGTGDATIASIPHEHLAGRISLIAAGAIKTPAQTSAALEVGLSLVAVGQGLVVNPDWVADARAGHDTDSRLSISANDVAPARIPRKLRAVIDATPGWFNVAPSSSSSKSTSTSTSTSTSWKHAINELDLRLLVAGRPGWPARTRGVPRHQARRAGPDQERRRRVRGPRHSRQRGLPRRVRYAHAGRDEGHQAGGHGRHRQGPADRTPGQCRRTAAAALWLCSPASTFVIGTGLVVDGGFTAQ